LTSVVRDSSARSLIEATASSLIGVFIGDSPTGLADEPWSQPPRGRRAGAGIARLPV
jgi:hypothetical protein